MTLDGISVLFAQMVPQPNAEGQEIKLVLMMVAFAVIMWFLMIAPQRKKAKETDLMLKALKSGDKIVTTSGIIGVVLSIKEKSVSIRSAETKLEILKSAVAEVTERSSSGEPSETKS
jgi:preprotein translocase subunit YajC